MLDSLQNFATFFFVLLKNTANSLAKNPTGMRWHDIKQKNTEAKISQGDLSFIGNECLLLVQTYKRNVYMINCSNI